MEDKEIHQFYGAFQPSEQNVRVSKRDSARVAFLGGNKEYIYGRYPTRPRKYFEAWDTSSGNETIFEWKNTADSYLKDLVYL